jgi:outer membrane protein assembly factor BamB
MPNETQPARPVQKPPATLLRRLRFPLIVIAICGALFAIPWIWIALGIDTDGMLMPFMVSQWHVPALGVLLIALWWVFFSSFRWTTRIAGVVAVLLVCFGIARTVREVELTMGRVGLVPRLHFVWEPTVNEQLADYLKHEAVQKDGMPPTDANIGAEDFPRYRGAKLDGVVHFANLQSDWSQHPPTVLWKHPCPGGYSGMAVAGNMVVTIEQRDTGECVVCYDRATGRQRWAYAYGVFYKDAMLMGDGPRSTPTIHAGHVYSLGALGDLVCLDANGKKVWSANVLTDAKAKNTKWGLSGSPLIVDDLVIANAGIDEEAPANSALIAYEMANGAIRWRAGNQKAGYSSPQLATLASVPQILLFDGGGLAGYDPKTGAELWQYPWVTQYEMNSIQPVVLGDDRVFISSEQQNGCSLVRVQAPAPSSSDKWKVETVWHKKTLAARYANPVTDGKYIYGLHDTPGILTCLDADTGNVRWKGDREGPGQLLLVGRQLLLINGNHGEVALFDTDSSACNELARFPVTGDKTWNTPALAGDQLFVRNQAMIACVKLPRK